MSKSQPAKDPMGAHVRAYHSILNSHAWRALSPTARALWLDLTLQAGATRNGTCGTHLQDSQGDKTGLFGRGWVSHHTVLRAARELQCLGFIELEVQGGKAGGGKTPNRWSLTHLDVHDSPHKGVKAHRATHAYQRWQSIEQARAALADLNAKNKVKRQKLPLVAADSALSGANLGADSAMLPKPKGQKMPLASAPKNKPEASIHAGCVAIARGQPSKASTMADSAHPNKLPGGTGIPGPARTTATRLRPLNWRLT